MLRDHEDGLAVGPQNFTVANAVRDWLAFGLARRDPATVRKCHILADMHIIPDLGSRKLRELSADDVDRWLAIKAKSLSTDTLRQLRSILKRAVARAQARDKVKRNVVLLCELLAGRPGRPSKAFNLDQAEAVVDASVGTVMYAYIVLSILIGARTEELRALTWDHVDLAGDPDARPPIPPSIMVGHPVRAGGETKTRQSRRTPALPVRCAEALIFHRLPGPAEDCSRAEVAWSRPGVRLSRGNPTQRQQRAPILPFDRQESWPQRGRLDTARDAPQLRIAAVRLRRTHREHRPAGRDCWRLRGNREGLPSSDPACAHRRR